MEAQSSHQKTNNGAGTSWKQILKRSKHIQHKAERETAAANEKAVKAKALLAKANQVAKQMAFDDAVKFVLAKTLSGKDNDAAGREEAKKRRCSVESRISPSQRRSRSTSRSVSRSMSSSENRSRSRSRRRRHAISRSRSKRRPSRSRSRSKRRPSRSRSRIRRRRRRSRSKQRRRRSRSRTRCRRHSRKSSRSRSRRRSRSRDRRRKKNKYHRRSRSRSRSRSYIDPRPPDTKTNKTEPAPVSVGTSVRDAVVSAKLIHSSHVDFSRVGGGRRRKHQRRPQPPAEVSAPVPSTLSLSVPVLLPVPHTPAPPVSTSLLNATSPRESPTCSAIQVSPTLSTAAQHKSPASHNPRVAVLPPPPPSHSPLEIKPFSFKTTVHRKNSNPSTTTTPTNSVLNVFGLRNQAPEEPEPTTKLGRELDSSSEVVIDDLSPPPSFISDQLKRKAMVAEEFKPDPELDHELEVLTPSSTVAGDPGSREKSRSPLLSLRKPYYAGNPPLRPPTAEHPQLSIPLSTSCSHQEVVVPPSSQTKFDSSSHQLPRSRASVPEKQSRPGSTSNETSRSRVEVPERASLSQSRPGSSSHGISRSRVVIPERASPSQSRHGSFHETSRSRASFPEKTYLPLSRPAVSSSHQISRLRVTVPERAHLSQSRPVSSSRQIPRSRAAVSSQSSLSQPKPVSSSAKYRDALLPRSVLKRFVPPSSPSLLAPIRFVAPSPSRSHLKASTPAAIPRHPKFVQNRNRKTALISSSKSAVAKLGKDQELDEDGDVVMEDCKTPSLDEPPMPQEEKEEEKVPERIRRPIRKKKKTRIIEDQDEKEKKPTRSISRKAAAEAKPQKEDVVDSDEAVDLISMGISEDEKMRSSSRRLRKNKKTKTKKTAAAQAIVPKSHPMMTYEEERDSDTTASESEYDDEEESLGLDRSVDRSTISHQRKVERLLDTFMFVRRRGQTGGALVAAQPRPTANFVNAGVYVDDDTVEPSTHLLPLPIRDGAAMLNERCDFVLPLRILHPWIVTNEVDVLRRAVGRSSWMPSPYIPISRNSKMQGLLIDDHQESPGSCLCRKPDKEGISCGSDCINRMLHVECVKGQCSQRQCSNQSFQLRNYKALSAQYIGEKGWGVILEENVKQGQFLIEYVGEIIDLHECERRLSEDYVGEGLFYFLNLYKTAVIDATRRGNVARFLNHSCDPNAETQKWNVDGELRVGLFALKDIQAGTELTFDYMYERLGTLKQKCLCGAANCRGYLGAKKVANSKKAARDRDESPDRTVEEVVEPIDEELGRVLHFDSASQMAQVSELVSGDSLPDWFMSLVQAQAQAQSSCASQSPIMLIRNLTNGHRHFQRRIDAYRSSCIHRSNDMIN